MYFYGNDFCWIFFLVIISFDGNEIYIIYNIEKELIFDIMQLFIFLKYFKNYYFFMLFVVVLFFFYEILRKIVYILLLINMQVFNNKLI